MNDIITKLKSLKPRKIATDTLFFLQRHNLTALIIFAGILVGLALVNVNDLTTNVSSQQIDNPDDFEITTSNEIALDESVKAKLLELGSDTDVDISSNIASYRRSAFSDATSESDWVVQAATLLEQYREKTESYPSGSQLISALRSQDAAFATVDPQGITVNQQGSTYTYTAEKCSSDLCDGFLLSAKIGSSIYQLGETDVLKRTWINDTAQALDVFYKFEDKGYYPLEKGFASTLAEFYPLVFEDPFVSEDPSGLAVNLESSDYTYRGIDCDAIGCQSFVLRTTFKDDASYFQQNQ